MNFPLKQILFSVLLVSTLAVTLPAQVSITFLASTSNAAASATGQSFTPGDAGTFPTSTAYLTQMQFQAGSNDATAIYLDIYSTLSSGAFSGYVGSSTNSQIWETEVTKTWTFDNLALDKNTTYFAVYSTDAGDGNVVNRPTDFYAGTNPYSGGDFIYSSAISSGSDAGFSATFNTTAIPEPSSYAALAGLAAFGLIAWRRRGR